MEMLRPALFNTLGGPDMSHIDINHTVAAFAADLPGAADVFRRHGIRFCCGGHHSLQEAAEDAGLRVEALRDELQALVDDAGRDAPEDTALLISHILDRYHETHRAELAWLIPLAQKVERVHGQHPEAPVGLAAALERLQQDLEEHMRQQERVLFPILHGIDSGTVGRATTRSSQEHEEETLNIHDIEHVTHGLALPEGACNSWRSLYIGVRKFIDDLVTHVYLENEKLFPRFQR